jgi:hypothetical protein
MCCRIATGPIHVIGNLPPLLDPNLEIDPINGQVVPSPRLLRGSGRPAKQARCKRFDRSGIGLLFSIQAVNPIQVVRN